MIAAPGTGNGADDRAAAPAGGPAGTGAAADESAEEAETANPDGPAKFYADRVTAVVVRPRTVGGTQTEASYVREAEAVGGVGLFRQKAGGAQFAQADRAVVTGEGPGQHLLSLFGTPRHRRDPAAAGEAARLRGGPGRPADRLRPPPPTGPRSSAGARSTCP